MIVRRDLRLGDLAAQLVHAAGETSPGNLPDDTHAVVLAVDHEQDLVDLATRLERAGIAHKLIREPDAPFNGAATALGVAPGPRRPLRRLLSRLPLLRGEELAMPRSQAFFDYLSMYVQILGMNAAGIDESPERTALEDRMDIPWRTMTEEDHKAFGAVSKVLNTDENAGKD